MMRAGGNAIDAIIATAAVLTVVEPCSNGLGSDLFALIWSPQDNALHGLNSSGVHRKPGRQTHSRAWIACRCAAG